MLKKVLTTAVLGVSTLGVMTANAAANGVYVTGQLGYANTHMKNKTNLADLDSKLPTGVVITPTDANAKNLSNNGLAGRLAIGYQFNQNFALEMGYLNLGSKKIDGSATIPAKDDNTVVPGSLKLNQNAIDFAAKGILPVASNMNVYGKVGVAYLSTTFNAKGDMTYRDKAIPATADLTGTAGIAKHKWAPEAALGVSYDITPNVSVDTSWTHIQVMGSKRPGNIDFVAVGLGYNFG